VMAVASNVRYDVAVIGGVPLDSAGYVQVEALACTEAGPDTGMDRRPSRVDQVDSSRTPKG
jgi:hypothetical protein